MMKGVELITACSSATKLSLPDTCPDDDVENTSHMTPEKVADVRER